jgi:hypothetical protein
MGKTKISELPVYTGSTTGVYLVMDSADLNTTYRVSKEDLYTITGSHTKIAYFSGSADVISSDRFSITNQGNTFNLGTDASNPVFPERLIVDNGSSFNIATFQTSATGSYAEVNIKNFGGGAAASSDLVLWNDATTEEAGYANFGLNSSNHTNLDVGYAGDAYLYNHTNDLYVGSLGFVPNGHGHLHLFGGGRWRQPTVTVYNDATLGINTEKYNAQLTTIPSSGAGFLVEISGSVKLNHDLKVVGNVTGDTFQSINNGNGTNFKVGDDAWIGDVNRANTIQISGLQDPTQGYIKFGSGSSAPSLGYGGSNDHVDLSCALKLGQFGTLPTGTVGELAVSGSNLFFHNGTSWMKVSLTAI